MRLGSINMDFASSFVNYEAISCTKKGMGVSYEASQLRSNQFLAQGTRFRHMKELAPRDGLTFWPRSNQRINPRKPEYQALCPSPKLLHLKSFYT